MRSNNDKVRSMLQGILQYKYQENKESLLKDYRRVFYAEGSYVPEADADDELRTFISGSYADVDTLLQLVDELPPYLFLASPRVVLAGAVDR